MRECLGCGARIENGSDQSIGQLGRFFNAGVARQCNQEALLGLILLSLAETFSALKGKKRFFIFHKIVILYLSKFGPFHCVQHL